ncbi:MAG: hypothetical protein ACRCWI_06030 [Brevinema sp.]
MPLYTIYGLLGVLCGVSVLAFIFSWSATKGFKFQSCKGDGSCSHGCSEHENKTAEMILALLKK